MSDSRPTSLLAGTLMTAGSRFGSLLVGLLASIVVARWLGPGGKGMLAAMGGVAGLATQVGNLGLQSALSYFAAQRPARAHGLSRLALAAAALVGLIAPAVIIALHRWLPGLFGPLSAWPLYLFLGVIPFSLAVLYCQSLLLGLQDLVGFNLVESGGRVISALVVPVWVFLDPTIVAAVEATLLVQLLTAGFAVARLSARLPMGPPEEAPPLAEIGRYSLRIFLNTSLVYLLVRSDVLILNALVSSEQVGWYSVAAQAVDMLLILPTSVGAVLFPRVTSRPAEGPALTARVTRVTIFIHGFACTAAVLLAPWLIAWSFGPLYAPSVALVRWLAPGAFALGIMNPIMQSLAGQGMPWAAVWGWFWPLLVNLGLNLALVPRYGAVAAAFASSLCYALAAGLYLGIYRRNTGIGWSAYLPSWTETRLLLQAVLDSTRRRSPAP